MYKDGPPEADYNPNNNPLDVFVNEDELDHVEYLGFSLMVFDVYKKKLDPINKQGTWNGFSPRWILPAMLRNPSDPERNTSAIILVIDS